MSALGTLVTHDGVPLSTAHPCARGCLHARGDAAIAPACKARGDCERVSIATFDDGAGKRPLSWEAATAIVLRHWDLVGATGIGAAMTLLRRARERLTGRPLDADEPPAPPSPAAG